MSALSRSRAVGPPLPLYSQAAEQPRRNEDKRHRCRVTQFSHLSRGPTSHRVRRSVKEEASGSSFTGVYNSQVSTDVAGGLPCNHKTHHRKEVRRSSP